MVLYDPPAPALAASTASKLAMLYKCKVSNVKAQCLLDTGTDGIAYVSESFCTRVGLMLQPPMGATDVKFADGTRSPVLGSVTVPVHLQAYHAKLHCQVIKLTTSFDIILGNEWLTTHSAILNIQQASCSLIHKGNIIILKGESSSAKLTSPTDSPPLVPMLSYLQFKRTLRKGARSLTLVLVEQCDVDGSHSLAPAQSPSPVIARLTSSSGSPHHIPSAQLDTLLAKYADVFVEELPGMPPQRPCPEVIPLEPGQQPATRGLYRHSPMKCRNCVGSLAHCLSKRL